MKTSLSLANQNNTFQFKGSLQTLTVLQLLENNPAAFEMQLAAVAKQTPNFFKNAPVIIDLEKLTDANNNIDLARIKAELLKYGMIPVGIRNGSPSQNETARAIGLGILAAGKNESQKSNSLPSEKSNRETGKIQTQPVRSGQQVYAAEGDLTVISSVSAGAELIAQGHIHVYGTLRGRALAGVEGNIKARIFCQKLEAELISIAGFYKLRDDIKLPKACDNGVQIYLEKDQLQIAAL